MLEKKYQDLMEAYQHAITRRGPDARYVGKEILYQEAGEAVHLSSVYAGRVIRKMLKESATKRT